MGRIVMKFGGSSVATLEKMRHVAELIKAKHDLYKEIVVVVSAMGDTTDQLEAYAYRASERPDFRELDSLMATGEQASAALLTMVLSDIGLDAQSVTGTKIGIKAFSQHQNGRIEGVDPVYIERVLTAGKIAVVAGFQGIDEDGDIMTLGRGGSDTSAVALAAALEAECTIYTDVDGIYTVDPRRYPKAKRLKQLIYDEATEMAYLGAKVIEPRSVELAQHNSVKLHITLNTGKEIGTVITESEIQSRKTLSNISVLDDILLVRIFEDAHLFNIASTIFSELAKKGINIDTISRVSPTENVRVMVFTAKQKDKIIIEEVLKALNISFEFVENLSRVSLIGAALRNRPGMTAEAFEVLEQDHIDFIEVTSSEINLSFIVTQDKVDKIVTHLADHFGL